jgi:zinc transport system substrate-binding protein
LISLSVLALTVFGCARENDGGPSGDGRASGGGALSVYAVSYPLKYFAERIGGEWVNVEFPAPDGVDPAFWSPDAEIVARYQSAKLVLLNGASYARWTDRVSLPTTRRIYTTQGLEEKFIVIEGSTTHSHGPAGEHSHGEIAFTTWLDPNLAVLQSRQIFEAFVDSMPERETELRAGLESLERDLVELDTRMQELAARSPDQPLLASHPVYQYLARRYELNLVSVHFEPDEIPDEGAWRELEELLSTHQARWMLWEDEPAAEISERLGALGVGSVVFHPCGNRPAAGDYLTVMRANLTSLEPVFAP